MIEKHDIIKMSKHVFKRGKGVPDRALMHPKRDWIIGVGFSLLLLLAGGGMSALLIYSYNNFAVEADPASVTVADYRIGLVESTITRYQDKRAQFEAARAERPVATPQPAAATTTEEVATSTEIIEIETEQLEVSEEPTILDESVLDEDVKDIEEVPTLVN